MLLYALATLPMIKSLKRQIQVNQCWQLFQVSTTKDFAPKQSYPELTLGVLRGVVAGAPAASRETGFGFAFIVRARLAPTHRLIKIHYHPFNNRQGTRQILLQEEKDYPPLLERKEMRAIAEDVEQNVKPDPPTSIRLDGWIYISQTNIYSFCIT